MQELVCMQKTYEQLKQILREITHLSSAAGLLHWDLETYMPKEGAAMRGETISMVSALCHEKFTSPEFERLITELSTARQAGLLDEEIACVVREVWRDFSKAKKLPKEFVAELSRVTSNAHHVWVEARRKSDFSVFAPTLKKIIALNRTKAEYYGYERSPYNALIDEFEPDATIEDIVPVFEAVKGFLKERLDPGLPACRQAWRRDDKGERGRHDERGTARDEGRSDLLADDVFAGEFDVEKQKIFCREILKYIGFPFERARLDETAHPFTQRFHPGDVRITTRYDRDNVFFSIGSTIHEAGHAFYDLGLADEHFGTPLGESLSLAIHESQSRLWENHVGKSRAFWTPLYPRLQEFFPEPFADISFEEFYRHLNRIKPSLIRTEADEVTYTMHIIIRFEMEREIIEGTLAVENIPAVWNQKVKHYLSIDVSDDAHGCLQDVHWSCGYFGYFPTYALGNLYAAQLFAAAERDILNLEEEIARGSFDHLREWLRTRVHVHGRRYAQDALIMNATGEKLNPRYFAEYITKKYSEI